MTHPKACNTCRIEKEIACFPKKGGICYACKRIKDKEYDHFIRGKTHKTTDVRLQEIKEKYERYPYDKKINTKKISSSVHYTRTIIKLKELLAGKIFCEHCGIRFNLPEEIEILNYRLKNTKEALTVCCCSACKNEFNRLLRKAYKDSSELDS